MTQGEEQWCIKASMRGGSFVKSFAETMLHADDENQQLLLPVLVQLMKKYPKYSEEKSAIAKAEGR